jgi:hypothetical protein
VSDKHPPRPRLTLNVGITGHRANALPAELSEPVSACLDVVLAQLRDAVVNLHIKEGVLFSAEAPILRLHTPLATGADQLAAESAHQLGYHVRALLPFTPAEYSNDFTGAEESREFTMHLGAADELFALPGERTKEVAAYVMVGKAVIAAADILIAVWDGLEANGLGGTAHVVDLALRAGVPVIHIAIDRDAMTVGEIRLLCGGDARDPVTRPIDEIALVEALVVDTLAPHSAVERELIADFYRETEKLTNWRFEYAVWLALLGIRRLPPRPWRQAPISAELGQSPDTHQRAYAWSNFLAIRHALRFRSGDVTNYGLSVLAVFIALSSWIVPEIKVYLVIAELGVIGLLFYNTRAGRKGEWHRRWLQYRHLAESLRPLVYLKRTGMAGPPFRTDILPGPRNRRKSADWTRWYTSAIWREMPSPTGHMTDARVRELISDIVEQQIIPQAAYHSANAKRMHELNHRLQELGHWIMRIVIAAAILYLTGYLIDPDMVKVYNAPFVILTAGLPTLSAALFGLRGHGEQLLAASRSAGTVEALNANAERLQEARSLEAVTLEMEATASIMLADLDEWTVAYSERSLEIPG